MLSHNMMAVMVSTGFGNEGFPTREIALCNDDFDRARQYGFPIREMACCNDDSDRAW